MSFPLLNISPSQLEFLFEAERELKSTLNLRNVHEGVRVAFKIKTTNSERFIVCPPAGIVEPGTTRLVRVYLKPHQNYEDELRNCRDRFLVQSIVVHETLDEQEITSNLFRNGQRQEAKIKVVVAAPLAHSSVLENEIRNIAMRQGVEGHREVVRKFSEVLMARGIISQAQVVLAFSTVGEIFQGLQHGYKASTAERERNFQQFLERGNFETSPAAEETEEDSPLVTAPHRRIAESVSPIVLKRSTDLSSTPEEATAATSAKMSPKGPTTPLPEAHSKEEESSESEWEPPERSSGGKNSQQLAVPNGKSQEEEKAEVNPVDFYPNPTFAINGSKRKLEFDNSQKQDSSVNSQKASGKAKNDFERPTMEELVDPESPMNDKENAAAHNLGRIHLLTEVDSEEIEAAQEAAAAADAQGRRNSNVSVEDPLDSEKIERPPSGKASWPPGSWPTGSKESQGKQNSTYIDRLATPAIRKSPLPAAARRLDAVLASARPDDSQSAVHSSKLGLSPSGEGNSSRLADHVSDAKIAHDAPSGLEQQDSLQSNSSTNSYKVPIPSGNTLKMANLFINQKK